MENYEALANAIVEQAARDYEATLVHNHKCNSPQSRTELAELESYFRGQELKWHTKLDGVSLMRAIKANVIAHNYDLKALNASRRKTNNTEGKEP